MKLAKLAQGINYSKSEIRRKNKLFINVDQRYLPKSSHLAEGISLRDGKAWKFSKSWVLPAIPAIA